MSNSIQFNPSNFFAEPSLKALAAQTAVAIGLTILQKSTENPTLKKLQFPLMFLTIGTVGYYAGAAAIVNLIGTTLLTGSAYYYLKEKPTESSTSNANSTETTSTSPAASHTWSDKTPKELESIIDSVDQLYRDYEKQDKPPGSYCVNFFKNDKPFSVSTHATRDKGTPLIGSPETHSAPCSLCKADSKKLSDDFKLLCSLSNRPLIIDSTSPTVNWFQMPKEKQLKMLIEAQQVQKKLQPLIGKDQLYLELHCGSHAGQTQWHTHLRFELTSSWKGLNWWNRIGL
ncbi:hypothetical protein [Simkania sp.]|uniref:hypothetical protein n=1 Tax=Simkania sp. TaxID=34094 RepID=UPI003B525209